VKSTAVQLVLLCAALAATGCGPEADCKSGLKQLRPRVEGAVNAGEHAEAREQISMAYAEMVAAEDAAAAGDFAGCVARIESARVLLNKSQRTNQQ
jgi:hypothetical protein